MVNANATLVPKSVQISCRRKVFRHSLVVIPCHKIPVFSHPESTSNVPRECENHVHASQSEYVPREVQVE